VGSHRRRDRRISRKVEGIGTIVPDGVGSRPNKQKGGLGQRKKKQHRYLTRGGLARGVKQLDVHKWLSGLGKKNKEHIQLG